jgi:NAD(P)-dependent dehydrogenase (short-subunit alcohol dehydrogenase family)
MASSRRFEGRVAFVTGAASGIGRATAMQLAREGAAVACVDIDEDAAGTAAAELERFDTAALAVACDVSSSRSVADAVTAAVEKLGPIDVLANVAGIGDTARMEGIETFPDERWERVLAVNLSGPFFTCRAIVPAMAERGRGVVVNVSSLAGRSKSANGGVAYTSSKAGLLGLTRHLAFDYGPRGVRVNAICPGGVDTPMLRAGGAAAAASEAEKAAREARIAAYGYFMPIKRLSSPQEQAAAIAFLASDDASYINGVALDVNGGLHMG